MSQDPTSGSNEPLDPTRRRVLTGIAATAAGAAGLAGRPSLASPRPLDLPNPADSGIDHIVVVMMENRSFDHMMGWVPGADGMQQGLSYTDTTGNTLSTFPMQGSLYGYQGCGFADPDHSYQAGHNDYNGGKMDGFLLPQPAGDLFPIGYYNRDDVLFYSGCADNWTICDHYHTGILSCTFPNRVYMHSGQTDRLSNTLTISKLPTIWDSLIANKVSSKYYFADTPITALWGAKYLVTHPITHQLEQFVYDFSPLGKAPSVSYIDPYFGLLIGEALGTSWDDHAFADIRDGQCFLNFIYNVLRHSPAWERTLLVINYDEWGGFFDHVAPPLAPVSEAEAKLGNDGRLGIRTPCVIIGPRARRAHVESTQFDPQSILNLIGWRFGFTPPGVRAATSTNLAAALDFTSPLNTTAPTIDVSYSGKTGPFPVKPPFLLPPPGGGNVFGGLCRKNSAAEQAEIDRRMEAHQSELKALRTMAKQSGYSF
ncbi:MAG: alkaline phosphatase family protein [Nevskia sp.]|nr:alkaline phosphatase family protein [Nevskia sp.]